MGVSLSTLTTHPQVSCFAFRPVLWKEMSGEEHNSFSPHIVIPATKETEVAKKIKVKEDKKK